MITQMVRENNVAFHGLNANRDSIGIEHADVCNDPSPYTETLYQRSAELVREIALRRGFAINNNTVFGHDDPRIGNHGDPGPYWDWEYYFLLLSWNGLASNRPIRQVRTILDQSTVPAGWLVRPRREIPRDRCANRNDPYGARYWSSSPSEIGGPAVFKFIINKTGRYKVSLWWPRAPGTNSAVPVDIQINCISTACTDRSAQNVVVDQSVNFGRWNDIGTPFTVANPAVEGKVTFGLNPKFPIAGPVINYFNPGVEAQITIRRNSHARGQIL